MNDDVRKTIYTTLTLFLFGVILWIGFLFVNACGFTLTCKQGNFPVDRTPMPTLLPATMPAMQTGGGDVTVSNHETCRVAAVDLVGAWVSAGASETEVFQFTDINLQNCEATFTEVKPLFVDANLWYSGSRSCVSCHSVDMTISSAQLDLSSYAGITSGSRRADSGSKGTDILGAGKWESSLLFDFISTSHADAPGHKNALSDLVIFAGKPHPVPEPTITPTP
ncbi:MAG: hypothetical protein HOP27_01905 [Anaerolineales bacterium]|nr:hypothetical protein [Anaerolineales bacterium]